MASVKVAVRVRPFNQREKDMNAKLIIQMEGKKTRIWNSKISQGKDGDLGRERYKDFTFDHSYWSFDENDKHFSSQDMVFQDLGTDVVSSAFEGYNACVFAYGQTGSGKTYTMMGSTAEGQGLIPRICKTLFNKMQEGKEKGASYRTEVSYLEIYNEKVKDLLQSDTSHSLRVREHPRLGPYVQDLSRHLVSDYSDIQELMTRGNSLRTTASTNMNDVSSRSHAIFTIMFVQAGYSNDMPSETVSKVHLVDLAGSERADTSGATGQRLKEGGHINKSLVTLGSVISALAEHSSTQLDGINKSQRSAFIPYRDSVLTWLLKDSLGGNSKTIMIAAVSPADCNYGETLSTLRYANRAKNIINKPTINEDPHVKLIRDLREEIAKLKALIGNEYTVEQKPSVLEELHQKEAQEKVLTEEWTEKWRETQKILQEQKALGLRKAGLGVVLDSDMPHLVGIDDNVLSTGVTLYHLKEGETLIGTEEATAKQDITLSGIGVEAEHCSVVLNEGIATLIPKHHAQCWVNSVLVDKPTRLCQGCIIVLGKTIMFRYNDPVEAAKLRKQGSFSQLNLSRLSLLSWSTTDLARSTENLDISCEDGEQTEALNTQRTILLKEREAFKKEQAEREQDWERLQQEKKEALESAQRELEQERQQMEHEYEEQCRKLAEDWERLEKHQQENLALLKQKEAELQQKREMLEWEKQEELSQVDSEAKQVAALRTKLEQKQIEFEKLVGSTFDTLQPFLNSQKNGITDLRTQFIQLLEKNPNVHSKKGMDENLNQSESSPESWASFDLENGPSLSALRELVNTHKKELASLEAELRAKVLTLSEHRDRVDSINAELESIQLTLQEDSASLEAMKKSLAQRTEEQRQEILRRKQSLSLDLKKSISNRNVKCEQESPGQTPKLQTDVSSCSLSSLGTADTFHTAASPCSVQGESRINIENIGMSDSGVGMELREMKKSQRHLDGSVTNRYVGKLIQDKTEIYKGTKKLSSDDSDDVSSTEDCYKKPMSTNSPNSFENISPPSEDCILRIRKARQMHLKNGRSFRSGRKLLSLKLDAPSLCVNDAFETMKNLSEEVSHQKMIIMQSLENDCSKNEINSQIAVLQELQRQYVRLEIALEQRSLRPQLENMGSSEDSDGMSTSADDCISDLGICGRLENDSFSDGSPLRRIFNPHQRILHRRLGSPVSPMLYTSNSSLCDEDSMSNYNTSISTPNSDACDGWISIPAYVLRGAGASTHYEYEVRVNIGGERWTILRRYKKFRELHLNMKDKYGTKVEVIPFPPRQFFAKNSEIVARQRRKQLETYLRQLLDVCSTCENCPLFSCRENPSKLALLEFSSFFRKGVFENGKFGTS